MAPLNERLFEGSGNIPADALRALEARDLAADAARIIGTFGGFQQVGGYVGVELTPDNSRVVCANFAMVGYLSAEPAILPASKLWANANKDVLIHFTFPLGQEFMFNSGNMASNYICSDRVKAAASKDGQPILPTDWPVYGLGNFCLRIIATVDRSSNSRRTNPAFKYTVLFFPHTEEELAEISDEHQGCGWPGIKILEGKAEMVPRAPDGSWGCPVFPIIKPGTSFAQLAAAPSGAEFRYQISKVIGSARKPVSCTSHNSLQAKWRKILDDVEQYEEIMPAVTWPTVPRPAPEQGSYNTYLHKGGKEGGRGGGK